MSMGSGGIFGAPMKMPWDKTADRFGFPTPPARSESLEAPDFPQQPTAQQRAPSVGQLILGTIGDTISQWAGGRANFLPAMQMQRQRQQEMADEQRRQASAFTNWQRQKEWERANPDPQAPTEFERAAQAGGFVPGSPEYQGLMRRRAEAQAMAPPMVVNNPDGTRTVYPAGAIPQGPAAITAPVGKLTPMGGPTQPASGMFPVR